MQRSLYVGLEIKPGAGLRKRIWKELGFLNMTSSESYHCIIMSLTVSVRWSALALPR